MLNESSPATIAVMVEPLEPHSDQKVMELLDQNGATQVDCLAPGFISATIREDSLETLKRFATISIKSRKQKR